MPHADAKYPMREIPVKLRPAKLGFRCQNEECTGTLVNDVRRWWLRCDLCKRIFLQDE